MATLELAAPRVSSRLSLDRGLLLLFLFLLPIDATQYLRFEVYGYQVSILDLLLVALLFLVFLTSAIRGLALGRFPRAVLARLGLALLLSLVSLLYIPSGLMGYDVKMTLNFVEFAVLIFVCAYQIDDFRFLRQCTLAVLLGCSIVAVLTLLKSYGFDLPGYQRASARFHVGPFLVGVSGLTHHVAMLIGALPIALGDAVLSSRAVRAGLSLLLGFALFIGYARGVWLGAAVALAVHVFLLWRRTRSSGLQALGALSLLVCLGVLLVEGPELYRTLVDLRPGTVKVRVAGYLTSVDLATESPLTFLFGAGKGRFAMVFGEGVPHNVFLELLVSKGILTLLVLVSLVGLLIRALVPLLGAAASPVRAYAEMGLVTLAGMITEGCFAPITNSLYFWVEIALVTAFVRIAWAEGEEDVAPGRARSLAK
jgi:hypothetical protein